MSKKKIPKYRSLGAVVRMLYTVGFLCALATIMFIVIATPLFINKAFRSFASEGVPILLLIALVGFLAGLLVIALGSGLAAFRDLAINAWHIRTELERQRRTEDEP